MNATDKKYAVSKLDNIAYTIRAKVDSQSTVKALTSVEQVEPKQVEVVVSA